MRINNIQQLALVTVLGGAFMVSGTVALADGHESRKKMDMAALDADKDGFLTMEEGSTDAYIAENFKKFDGNGDGKIDEAEFAAMEAESRRKMGNVSITESFAELDTDGNGKLSKAELEANADMAEMSAMFSDMDMNQDGEVDENEAMDFESKRKQEVSG